MSIYIAKSNHQDSFKRKYNKYSNYSNSNLLQTNKNITLQRNKPISHIIEQVTQKTDISSSHGDTFSLSLYMNITI